MHVRFSHTYEEVIAIENFLLAWQEFVVGKREKYDAQEFGRHLVRNVIALHDDCMRKTYRHGAYHAFVVADPKPRSIHKATVRDRLLHHALHRLLYPYFDARWIADVYSSRTGKGTHRAMDRLRTFAFRVSRNHTRTTWVLQCDIRKFFASIDHRIMLGILDRAIADRDVLWLLEQIICSFWTGTSGVGLPLGNLTSQLFVNVYMNEFDQFMKQQLRARWYVRYADDFVVLHHDRRVLDGALLQIASFLHERLRLHLHPQKTHIATLASGVDFLGWVHFPDHRVLRTTTKRRMMRALAHGATDARVASYAGMLTHGNAHGLRDSILREYGAS